MLETDLPQQWIAVHKPDDAASRSTFISTRDLTGSKLALEQACDFVPFD
jgi:hypothetical protein